MKTQTPTSKTILAKIIQPPYGALPWLVCLYSLLAAMLYTANSPFTGHIVGFDDQVRMTQVLNLVNGAGWYDRVLTRVNAPEGFESIWTRIVDIPFALVILVAQNFVAQRVAALIATVVVSMAAMVILFYASRYAVRPLVGKRHAWLVVLFLVFTTVLDHKHHTLAGYHLGEASHHAWYGILNVLMYGAAARLALNLKTRNADVWLAVAVALLLAVGIEGFPMIAGTALVLSVTAWLYNKPVITERGSQAFAGASLLALVMLPIHAPLDKLFDVSFSQPSILGPILVVAASIYLFAQTALQKQFSGNRWLSLMGMAVCGAGIATLLLLAFPQIQDGPAAALSPLERKLAFSEHPEAWPMFVESTDIIEYIGFIMPSLLAIIAGIIAIKTTRSSRRRIYYTASLGYTVIGAAMAQALWRYYHHAMTGACWWLLWAWQNLKARWRKRNNASLKALLAFIMLGPFWMILLPAIDENGPFVSHVLLYPAKVYEAPDGCEVLGFADYLNTHYPPATLVDVPDWETARFVYYTNLRVDFLSNYPSHDKFVDNKLFFQTQNEDIARDIAIRHRLDLVSICSSIPMSRETALSRPNREPYMIERLREGNPPSWLKPVPLPIPTQYMLFEVDKNALLNNKD
ncbi:MAG: hypothetical protein JO253_10455 [Alphaproteobacteria bacterium]|nr:hypothetical protein [Alphaproteobacteria bacterium]